MTTIGDLLVRDLAQRIEEVIKLDQTNEQSVFTEITEYVATDRLKREYRNLLKAIADAPSEPHEGVGVWISGFFGSGKSSFAKNLGYVLANREVLGNSASELFLGQVDDQRIRNWVNFINASIPLEVIMFDVSVDRAVRRTTERLAEIMYTVLLRELDYAEDYDVAELEIELEAEGVLDDFVALCSEIFDGREWRTIRKGAQKISRASAILHHLDSSTYPTEESWAQSLQSKADISVGQFVERCFELTARRRPGRGLVFIIDEVGQYVARSADKIEDLRALVEQFGKESRNRLQRNEIVSPTWIIVTSQEKLEEVVASIDSRRIELAKLRDRFRYPVDLAPEDIHEVATRRVLAKREDAEALLRKMFREHEGRLNVACQLERTTRSSTISEDEFVQFYPYLPHYVEMSIDIMSGIRLQPGAPKHYGGSNRTIIKQVYEMLVSERTDVASMPVGRLVTLDKVFELVEGNLSTEKRKDISDVQSRLGDEPELGDFPLRVAKVIALLEFIRDLPRTEKNIAACLVDEIGQLPPIDEVERALTRLEEAQFVRNTEEGWKLQTAQEKSWETERAELLSPKGRERNDILRETLHEIFDEPQLRTFRYRNLRTFRVGIAVDGMRVGDEGQIPLALMSAESPEQFQARMDEARSVSRQDSNALIWAFALDKGIDDAVANLFASRQMTAKYDQIRTRSGISNAEAACLSDERRRLSRYQRQLRDQVTRALENGTGLFRGASRDGASLGSKASEIFKGFFSEAVPVLYPKLEMGACQLSGDEAEEILKAASLSRLSDVFYGGQDGLGLVIKDGSKYAINSSAPIAEEILGYLKRQHDYGERDTRTGKHLETHFGGLGYGWERDVLRLVLAVLFREGAIEASFKGRTHKNYKDRESWRSFTNNPAFRNSVFTPVKPIDRQTLRQAVENYEALTGETVDMDKNAIADRLQQLARTELEAVKPLEYQVYTHRLPVLTPIQDYRLKLEDVLDSSADDCVKTLADEGNWLAEARERIQRIAQALDEDGIADVQFARLALAQLWPLIRERGHEDLAATADELNELLGSETYYEQMQSILDAAERIADIYFSLYDEAHQARLQAYAAAIEAIQERPEWSEVAPEMCEPLLRDLESRACASLDIPGGDMVCVHCDATLVQLESDLAALNSLKSGIIARLQEIIEPDVETETVRVAEYLNGSLDTADEIERAIERLRQHLLDLADRGIRIILE